MNYSVVLFQIFTAIIYSRILFRSRNYNINQHNIIIIITYYSLRFHCCVRAIRSIIPMRVFSFSTSFFFSTGFGVEVLKVSPVLIATLSVCLLLILLATIVVVRLKSSNNRKRNARQPASGDKQVIVHQRSNGQVATAILETDTDPDLIQVKYGKNN